MKKNTKRTDIIIIIVLLLIAAAIVFAVIRSRRPDKQDADTVVQTKSVTVSDYNGKKIGILTGTNMEQESFDHFPDSEYLYYKGYPDLNAALLNGSIDLFLADEAAAKSIHAEQPKIDYIKDRLTVNKYSFAFRKDDAEEKELCGKLNEFLKKAKADGTLDAIDAVWYGADDSKKVVDMSGLSGENGTIHVITTSTDEPFSYIKDGKNVGYDIDVVVRFCREYGFALELGDVDFNARIPAIASGKYEFTTSMNVTPEREEEVMFSDPVSEGGIVAVVRAEDVAGTGEPDPLSYNGKKMGIVTGSSYEPITFKYFPDSEYSYYNGKADIIAALKQNIIDGFLCDEPIARIMTQEEPKIDYIKKTIIDDNYSFALQKDNAKAEKLCAEFNEFLAKVMAEGKLDELNEKWFSQDESKKTINISGYTGENGTLNLSVLAEDAPFSYVKDNDYAGIGIELIEEFCLEYGYKPEFSSIDTSAAIPSIASGKFDMLIGPISITEERKESVIFTDSFYKGGICLVIRASDIAAQSDSAGVTEEEIRSRPLSYYAEHGKFGAITGGLYEVMLNERFPDTECLQFNAQTDLAIALREGKIDAFTCPVSAAEDFMKEDPNLTYLNEVFMEIPYGIAFQKTDGKNELRDQFNEFFAKIQADGTYDEVLDIWFGDDESRKNVDIPTTGSRVLKYVTTATMQPYTYVKDGKNAGLEVDLIARFCKEYGYGLEIATGDFGSLVAGVSSGTYDLASGNIMITEERAQSVDFSDVYYTTNAVAVVRKDLDTQQSAASAGVTEEEIRSRPLSYYAEHGKFGAITGGLYEVQLKERFPETECLQFNAQTDLAIALREGKIDAFTCPVSAAEDFMKEDPNLTYLNEVFMEIPYGIAFQKTDGKNELRDQFNEFFAKIQADGTYDEVLDIWFGDDESRKNVDIPTTGSRVLKYVTTATMQPYTYVKDGKNAGLEVDLIARFCKEYGYGLEIATGDFGSLVAGVSSGTYDLASGNIMITEERAQSVDFSDVYYTTNAVAVVRKDLDTQQSAASAGETDEKKTFISELKESFKKNFIREDRYKLIIEGVKTTCFITIMTIIFGSVLSFLICMFRRTESKLANIISNIYVKLLQGTPMVVLLMILYYVIFGKSGISAVWVAIIGFTLNFAAYTSEIMRSGIESIDGGQREAALALGYTENQAFFKFIFPQAAVRFLPVYNGEIITLLKGTSVVGYIAIQDLTKMSDIIRSRTYEAFFPLIVTAIIYFALAWILSLILKLVLKKIDPKKRKRSSKEAA